MELVAGTQDGVTDNVDLLMALPVAPAKFVKDAVSDQPKVPPRLSLTVMSLRVPMIAVGANGLVIVPKLMVVGEVLTLVVPRTGERTEDWSVEPTVGVAVT